MSVNQYIHVMGLTTAIQLSSTLGECNPYSTKFCGSYVPCGLYNKLEVFIILLSFQRHLILNLIATWQTIGRVLGIEKRLSFLVPKQNPNYDTQDITVILYRILMDGW